MSDESDRHVLIVLKLLHACAWHGAKNDAGSQCSDLKWCHSQELLGQLLGDSIGMLLNHKL